MAVRIRLARGGSKKKPFYRVVAADSRMPRDGRHLEIVGRYNPRTEPSYIEFNKEKVTKWLARGAQPSNTVKNLLAISGISLEKKGKEKAPEKKTEKKEIKTKTVSPAKRVKSSEMVKKEAAKTTKASAVKKKAVEKEK